MANVAVCNVGALGVDLILRVALLHADKYKYIGYFCDTCGRYKDKKSLI